MLAVNTNVVVRFLVGDDPDQTATAATVIKNEQVFVTVSVILEVEWVLRSYYKFPRGQILVGLRSFAGLENVVLQHRSQTVRALNWFAQGMDFGDALHLSLAEDSNAFLTFDRALIKSAQRLSAIKVRLP